MQHFIVGRGGQRLHLGKTLHEPLVIRNDGCHLGLLQHDFRDPDAIRRDLLLPGQVLAAGHIEPAEQGGGEFMTRSSGGRERYFYVVGNGGGHSDMMPRLRLSWPALRDADQSRGCLRTKAASLSAAPSSMLR